MKWSYKIGEVKGIDLYIHATFLLLVLWFGFIFYSETGTFLGILRGLAFMVILFSLVVFHELSHALTAQRFGIKTKDIILLPIGGMSRMERMPDKPWQEFLVALAGPLSNLLIAGLIYGGLLLSGKPIDWKQSTLISGNFWVSLFVINLVLAGFNLLPAFPMDGGRLLRAALASKMDYVRATQIAAYVGQGFAVLLGLMGLMVNPILILIALFVWIGAASESSITQLKGSLRGIPVSHVMIREFHVLSAHHTLDDVVQLMSQGFQHDFPVMQNHHLLGMLSRQHLLKALTHEEKPRFVEEIMSRDFEVTHPHEMLDHLLNRLGSLKGAAMPVMDQGKLVGLITLENLGEYFMFQSVLKKR